MIEYHVNPIQPHAHLFEVRMEISQAATPQQTVSLPNWIPGSYLIRDFAKHIISIAAYHRQGEHLVAIPIQKQDSNSWVCATHQQALTIIYTVYAGDISVRGAYLDETQAFFNGCSLFLFAEGLTQQPHRVNLQGAQGWEHWRVATTLTSETKPWTFGWYRAETYDELIDHPVQMGNFELLEFKAHDIDHAIAITGRYDGDTLRLRNDVQKVCETHLFFFGGEKPFNRYLFLLNVTKDGYGGLEHRSSSALMIQRDAFPVKGDPAITKSYINLVALFSHEYFHAWHIKRIKPEKFMPYDLHHKVYTTQLWAFEGMTSYYDELALVRAKIITPMQYLDLLAQTMTRLLRNLGRKKQSVADSSFDAWIKFYQPNENSPNSTVSYYVKGSMVSWLTDFALRQCTQNQKSLDDVMKYLWLNYGQQNKGVPEGEIEKIINTFSGNKLEQFLHQMLYTTQELPFKEYLAQFGINMKLRGSTTNDDLGGNVAVNGNGNGIVKFNQGVFGIQISKISKQVIVTQVFEGGAAQKAGLCPQDELIAINGFKVDSDTYDRIAKRLAVGQQVEVTLFRQDMLISKKVVLQEPTLDTVVLTLADNMSSTMRENLNRWLMLDPREATIPATA